MTTIDPNALTIIVGAICALLTGISLYRSNQVKDRAEEVKVRVDEVVLLREEVARLHKQLESQEEELAALRHENSQLYHILRKFGIDVEGEIAAMSKGGK